MTTTDFVAVGIKLFGAQCLKGSKPPHDILFCDGLVSLDAITGEIAIGDTAPIHICDFVNELEAEKKKNGGDFDAILAQVITEKNRPGRVTAQAENACPSRKRKVTQCMSLSQKKGHTMYSASTIPAFSEPKIFEDELTGYIDSIRTGRLVPQQLKSGRWILHLGQTAIETDDDLNDYNTEDRVRLAKEALEPFVVEDGWEEECSESEPVTNPSNPPADPIQAKSNLGDHDPNAELAVHPREPDLALVPPTALRLQLRKNDLDPIPVEGKIPHMKGWETKLNVSAAEIRLWEKSYHLAYNTGVVAKRTPGLDIDIMHEAAAKAIEDLAREYFGEHGDIYVRFGLPPKRLIPLRTDEPFPKLSRVFAEPKGPDGKEPKIEVLCDGQQWVAAGIHSSTHKSYRWFGGDLETIKRENLPYVRREDMERFLAAAAKLLVEEFGFVLAKGSERKINGRQPPAPFQHAPEFADLPDEDLGEGLYDPPELGLIAAALAVIPHNDNNPHSADYWTEIGQTPGRDYMVKIGMAVKAASDGRAEVFPLFDKWRQAAFTPPASASPRSASTPTKPHRGGERTMRRRRNPDRMKASEDLVCSQSSNLKPSSACRR
jgi:hypothetical protein